MLARLSVTNMGEARSPKTEVPAVGALDASIETSPLGPANNDESCCRSIVTPRSVMDPNGDAGRKVLIVWLALTRIVSESSETLNPRAMMLADRVNLSLPLLPSKEKSLNGAVALSRTRLSLPCEPMILTLPVKSVAASEWRTALVSASTKRISVAELVNLALKPPGTRCDRRRSRKLVTRDSREFQLENVVVAFFSVGTR